MSFYPGIIKRVYYFNVVNTGVKSNRIPYRGRGNGGKSKYIQGLIRFWKIKKGLGEKEATRAAFALANKHKKEGMFTANSRKFAAFKRRFKFFNRITDDNKDINKVVDKLENDVPMNSRPQQMPSTYQFFLTCEV